MKWFGLLVLLLPAFGWWCETSDRHGCRGKSRHFVREAAVANPFLVFENIKTGLGEEATVVDWDGDGDLDVILKKQDGLSLLEFKSGMHFAEVIPNPFHGIPGGVCRPEVVDWDGDGRLDLIVGAKDGIRYYQKQKGPYIGYELHQRLGAENPFERIWEAAKGICSDIFIGDWDGDGDLDVILSSFGSPMRYFEQSQGQLVLRGGLNRSDDSSPFYEIENQTVTHRPIMVDWNGDGNMDIVLVAKYRDVFLSNASVAQTLCTSYLYEQHKIDGKTTLVFKDEPFFRNEGCSSFDGFGVSFVDVDKDGDLDAIFGSTNGPLRVYKRTSAGLVKPSEFPSNSTPLDMIQLGSKREHNSVPVHQSHLLRPVLADWDLDGDLDLALIHPPSKHLEKNRYFLHLPDDTVTELNGPPNSSCPIDWGRPFSMADFDGDGKNDLLGFASYRVVVCLQSSSGFIVVEPGEIPFNSVPNCPQCLTDLDSNLWTAGIFGFPSFLDWDGDGDLDVLRTNLGDQVFLYEQLSNGTVFAHPLLLPLARDFSAADFDGDGDVDIMIIPLNSNGCLYFERLGDGSLEQMFGTDNPFNGACEENSNGAVTSGIYASLADWDGDGEKDLIVVDDFKVTLWTNRPMQSFVEVMEKDSPFGKFAFPEPLEVTLVDVNHDFRLDLVIPAHSTTLLPPAAILGYETFRFFEQGASGLLVERQGEANPFDKLAFNKTIIKYSQPFMKTQVVDLDGDGDLDIVRAFRYDLHYARNDGGHFTHLNPSDPENPFRGVQDNLYSCWTFVDWDEDGDMDLLQAYQPGGNTTTELVAYAKRAGAIIREMLNNGSSRDERVAWTQKNLYRQMRFYRNVGGSFQELTGSANPFRDLASSMDIDKVPSCPAFVDLDKDDVLELVLSTTNGQLQYFKQLNGTFQRVEETPFADLSSKVIWNQAATNNNNIIPRFVDWDGDGDMDLVITGLHKVHFFQRGVCTPSASYCKSGLCNQRTSTCTCDAGAEGQDCSLCGNFYVREKDQCRPCPGHNELAGTCSRRGICEDDADARNKRRAKNLTGFEMISARGTGQCTCSRPFSGLGCREGQCPVGERLDRHAKVETATEKYPQWEACVPCESGKFKNFSGNEECRPCPGGHVPLNRTSCVPCGSGTVPSRDHPENCTDCPEGFVAAAGTTSCVACKAGTAPNEGRSACVACEAGTFARPRSKQCEICPLGEVPNKQNNGCDKCTGQTYAFEGDESCRTCFFPALILTGDENLCTPVYTGLFLFASILLAVFVLAIFGRLRVECLKRRLKKLVAARNWKDLHTTQAKPLEYGLWQRKADKLIEHRKDEVKSRSLQLGISLDYVFGQLKDIYREKAQQAEWRVDVWGPTTRSGFLVRVRNSGDAVDPESAWPTLSICDHPEDPNFHQVAALLAYGPWALGKGLCCPRDGLADCSLVDALETECNSAKATWFLSWVWNYQFTTVLKALARWWQRHRMVLGAADDGKGIYIWWCLFVNNQFRLLEEGQTQDTNDFFHVFGQQVEGIGKMLMCLDQMRGSQYTSRIWCIFEVFVACQRSIPTTVILPELEVGAIETLEDLTKQCRVDAEKAKASVQADADAIKERIQKEHQSFEYVNKTVEQALWCEVIKFLEQSQQPEEIEQSTETPQEPDLSSSSVPASAMVSANSQCSLQ